MVVFIVRNGDRCLGWFGVFWKVWLVCVVIVVVCYRCLVCWCSCLVFGVRFG